LNTLYPDCTHAVTVPVCYKTQHNIGWVRLGVWILVPTIIALLMMLLISGYLSRKQQQSLDHARQLRKQRSVELGEERRRCRQISVQHQAVQQELDERVATEAQRVERAARRLSVQYINAHLAANPQLAGQVPSPRSPHDVVAALPSPRAFQQPLAAVKSRGGLVGGARSLWDAVHSVVRSSSTRPSQRESSRSSSRLHVSARTMADSTATGALPISELAVGEISAAEDGGVVLDIERSYSDAEADGADASEGEGDAGSRVASGRRERGLSRLVKTISQPRMSALAKGESKPMLEPDERDGEDVAAAPTELGRRRRGQPERLVHDALGGRAGGRASRLHRLRRGWRAAEHHEGVHAAQSSSLLVGGRSRSIEHALPGLHTRGHGARVLQDAA